MCARFCGAVLVFCECSEACVPAGDLNRHPYLAGKNAWAWLGTSSLTAKEERHAR